tara:strand:+ start:9249 stop:11519 length:2271 start_codon:yes stop_codon:yes gene_type:complete
MKSTILGFPRIGKKRELKFAVEKFWRGEIDEPELQKVAAHLRREHLLLQKRARIDYLTSNDFSFYDQMLDMSCTLGAIPERYNFKGKEVDLKTYFQMARGDKDVTAMEMTKWFDTNYHYIVPEFSKNQKFSIKSYKYLREYTESKKLLFNTRPVFIGPLTFLLLGKNKFEEESTLVHLDKVLPLYQKIINDLEKEGASWIQFDEPILSLDLKEDEKKALIYSYKQLSSKKGGVKLFLTSYFEDYGQNSKLFPLLEVDAIHFDLCAGTNNLESIKSIDLKEKVVSLGIVDGRNIWRNHLAQSIAKINEVLPSLCNENVWLSTSCSLLHSPYDLNFEKKIDQEIKNWLSFSVQKLEEVSIIKDYFKKGIKSVEQLLRINDYAMRSKKNSLKVNRIEVKEKVSKITGTMLKRKSEFKKRKLTQEKALGLPKFPTTTIGSFPQTKEVRTMRSSFKKGKIPLQEYTNFIREKTQETLKIQEDLGLDVLVHGEFERNDMVEYFGELIEGFAFTINGWVQSYGSRCVKPPIIYGDLKRTSPMTVGWSSYAQSLTKKPVKGMLTGPVTMLKWSFVRNDIPYDQVSKQMALVLRDEVNDLEDAGIKIIQIDEPALKEAMPLKSSKWSEYFNWSIQSFRLCSSGIKDETQIHTHMCYSEFNDIIDNIAALDADVISIETSRSQMELLEAFKNFQYPSGIGPGVYDIHSPRVPTKDEMKELLTKAKEYLNSDQLWVNPDCGLKTRGWKEVTASLYKMVEAAKELREL